MAKEIIIEANGQLIFPYNYTERAKTILDKLKTLKLTEYAIDLKEVREFNKHALPRNRMPEPKLDETQFSILFNDLLRNNRPMNYEETKLLSEDDIYIAFREFSGLMTALNEYLVLVPDKTLFCAFMGCSTASYDKMKLEPRLSTTIEYIEDYLQHITLTAGKNGTVKERSAIMQLTAKDGIGHNVVSASEQVTITNNTLKIDMQELNNKRKIYQRLLK